MDCSLAVSCVAWCLLLGCASTKDADTLDTGEPTKEQPSACTSEFATVTGTVRSQYEYFKFGEAIPFAIVSAIPKHNGDGPIELLADEHGVFRVELPEDEYSLMGRTTDCVSSLIPIAVTACAIVEQDIDLTDCLEGAVGR